MKKLLLIPVLLSTLVLTGCGITPKEAYEEASKGCTMSGYTLRQHTQDDTIYYCESKDEQINDKFSRCAYDCDQAIDDIRDNVGEQSVVNQCLKLCMGE